MEITLISDDVLRIEDDGSNIQAIRGLPSRKWDPPTKSWFAPFVQENLDYMRKQGCFPTGHLPPKAPPGYEIDRPEGYTFLTIKTLGTPDDVQKCKRIPERRQWSQQYKAWVCHATSANFEYLLKAFPQAVWTTRAAKNRDAVLKPKPLDGNGKKPIIEVVDFKFPGKPRKHQETAFALARGKESFALLMEQRTGKCYVEICEVMDLRAKGKVNGWLIICPNSVKDVWPEEIEKWMPAEFEPEVFVWGPETRYKIDKFLYTPMPGKLKVLVMNVEAIGTDKGWDVADMFLSKYDCLVTVDEFTRFKTPSAQRTKGLIALRKKAKVRRILSGTPITQGPLDIFAPFKFLDPELLGFSSFFSFRNRYAVMGGFNGKQVVGYSNIEELQEKVDKHSYRILFSQCTDIEEPIFKKRVVELTPTQRRMYDEMRTEMIATFGSSAGAREVVGRLNDSGTGFVSSSDDTESTESGSSSPTMATKSVSVMYAITKFLRMAQIIGGFLPVETDEHESAHTTIGAQPVDEVNPKLQETLAIIEEYENSVRKFIIWARFRAEIDLIQRTLREKYGSDSVVEFHGGITEHQRGINRKRFQDLSDPSRFFVGQPAAGGLGIPLYVADVTIFFSNDHSLETRLQAQSRPLLPEKKTPHTYFDIVAKNTYDVRMIKGLREKKSLSDLITGDPSLNWI